MNFELSPEQYLLGNTIRTYLLAECPPSGLLARWEAAAGDPTWDAATWQGLAGLGVASIAVPEAHGGLGMGVLELAVASQALGSAAGTGPWIGHWLATLAIARAGDERQRARWLGPLADGSARASLIWDERGTPVLGGRSADVFVACIDGSLGLLTAVEVTAEALPGIDPTRQIDSVVPVGEAQPLTGADDATAEWLRAAGHALVAADSFGVARHALDSSVAYAKTRQQWGQQIGAFQAVKHQLADLALLVEPGQGLAWYAAYALDEGLDDATDAAALAKAHLADVGVQAVRDAIELHGGFGYTWECDLHIYLKRALLNRQFLGDPERLREELADREFGAVS
ncbi:acyl-CoA dehydrogenase family protein [uncultured Jatrophihabitans sp.]|uniref:acyl-CoA dehydrogenase family protein n=1 Tax=uncultured Jatrophihabitans sp. TaxID=1610747 RepID=UPI0035CC9A9A